MFIALVYHEDVVLAFCGYVQQFFSADNGARRVVRVAHPVSCLASVSAFAAHGLASGHPACVGIFAECRHADQIDAAAGKFLVSESCRQVDGFGCSVGNHNLVRLYATFFSQSLFERVRFRLGIAAYYVHTAGQILFQTAEVGVRVDVRAEVRFHLHIIFIQVVSVSVNHRCRFAEFRKPVSCPRCGVSGRPVCRIVRL